ncbi:MAG: hypothetical protein PWP65_1627 [Clostridia bacterium]|nr:hypothetical protein [Clostridia bacterium]
MKTWRHLAKILLVLAALLVITPPVQAAEESLTITDLQSAIWPEYDEPRVLVLHNGTLVNTGREPFQSEIRYFMPKGATVNMVCETEKGMVCRPYEIDQSNPDFDVVSWKPSRSIQPGESFPAMYEYYYLRFSGGGKRDFTVPFQSAFPVKRLRVEVKAPKGATSITLDPRPSRQTRDSKGFENYYYWYPKVETEERLVFRVAYTRDTAEPSVTPQASTSGPRSQINKTVVLAVFIAALTVVLLLTIFGKRRSASGNGQGAGR